MTPRTVEVWCPGPSLVPHVVPAGRWVVTVNRAALAVGPVAVRHAIVARDVEVLRELAGSQDAVYPCLVMTDPAWRFAALDLFPRALVTVQTDLTQCSDFPFKRSKIVALALAHMLGAEVIELHGDDCDGTMDWDGVAAGNRRTPERWDSERAETDMVVALLDKRGTKVNRNRVEVPNVA